MIVVKRSWAEWNNRFNCYDSKQEYKVFDDDEKDQIQQYVNQIGDYTFQKI